MTPFDKEKEGLFIGRKCFSSVFDVYQVFDVYLRVDLRSVR